MRCILFVCLLVKPFVFIFSQGHFPICEAYVPKDTFESQLSYSNVMYAGVENVFKIKLGDKSGAIVVKTDNGLVFDDDEGNWVVMPSKKGWAMLTVFDKEQTKILAQRRFEVLNLPQPFISFNNDRLDTLKSVSKEKLLSNPGFKIRISDDIPDSYEWFRIKEILVGFMFGPVYVKKTCSGNKLSKEVLTDLSKLNLGKDVSLVFTLTGDGDVYKRLPPVTLKLF